METPKPNTSLIRSVVQRSVEDGIGIVIAILFFIIVIIIVLVATASSKSPWDTVIASLAMTSQAFFAYVVWRLGKAQYAFTQQVTDRQHKIDMYPLRRDAVQNLDAASVILFCPPNISDDQVEAFRLCHLEIKNLFSDEAGELAFELYQFVEQARRLLASAQPTVDDGGSISIPAGAEEAAAVQRSLDDAFDYLTDLQNIMDDEMRIR